MQKQGTARPTILIENALTRVTRWEFANKGDNTGWHHHSCPYMVLPLFDGRMKAETQGGNTAIIEMKKNIPYFRPAGIEHDVISDNEFACAFIEIEFLDASIDASG